jgi:hypothetical protein
MEAWELVAGFLAAGFWVVDMSEDISTCRYLMKRLNDGKSAALLLAVNR